MADLLLPNANQGDAAGDTYDSIENLRGSRFDDHLGGDNGNNVISGGAGNDFLAGRGGDDTLFGEGGDDWLSGDAGADHLDGGVGTDTVDYFGSASAVNLDLDTGGTLGDADGDTYAGIERVQGSDFADGIRGDAAANTLVGLSGDDILDGKGGNDTLDGGVGNDRLFGGAGADRLFGGEGIDIADYTDAASAVVLDLDTGGTAGDAAGDTFDSIEIAVGSNFQDRLQGRAAANDQLFGLAGDDFIFGEGGIDLLVGGSGRDFLDGGAGADLMRGEAGSDTYFVNNAGDVVDEANVNSSSADEIRASISVSLANPGNVLGEVENLTLVGAANINGTGNDLQNQITGNTGANTLDGGGDSDGLSGGAGNDTLLGGTGDDSLDGGSGADIMQGGADNDVYYVDNVGDVVDEAAPGSGGSDIIVSSISFSLANTAAVRGSIEYLVLAEGNSNINGTGNNLDNFIEGNGGANILSGGSGNDTLDGEAGNDRLDGGSGADSMFGGDGDDTYYVDNFGDKVIEANGAGTGMDTVRTTVSYSVVSQFVENVELLGSGSINAIGNNLNNTITGNAGNNAIDGRGGIDTMIGGAGNDTYYVDNVLDRTIEANGAGTDTVYTTVSKAFSDQFVEVIRLSGSGNINTTGNSLANTIVGNGANNAMNGRQGADTLTGGYGNDSFVFNTALGATNIDTITDFKPVDDTIQLDDAIFTSLGTGVLSANAFRSNATGLAQDADDRIIYETDTGRIYYDSNGNAAGGNFLVADLDSGLGVTNADFFIV